MQKSWVKSYEKGVPAGIQYPEVTLPQFLFDSARRYPKKSAMTYYGQSLSYEELETNCNQFANALIELGVTQGDRVALMLPNIPQYVIGFYGTINAGAIVVQVNPLYIERELEEQLNDSGAETLVALDIFYARIKNIQHKTALKRVILTRVSDFLPLHLKFLYPLKSMKEGQWVHIAMDPPLYDFNALVRKAESVRPVVSVMPQDTAVLQYTGGTTGIPKGVMLSHMNLVANAYQCRNWMPSLREGEEIFLGVVPFFHVYGTTTCLDLCLLIGGCLVLLPKFNTKEVLKAIVKHRITLFMGVQAMYVAINNYTHVSQYDLSSIRICISGAGPLHIEVQERFEALTGGKIVEGYGLSETSPVTHCTPIYGHRKKGSIGLPFPDTETKIVDPQDIQRERAFDEVGELFIRGPQVMQGYWRNPQETEGVLVDGWLRTGDMATMDQDGYFYIVDRKKDMIKTKGENVYPREIEEVLFRHPKIKEAVVVGIPDTFRGETIKAYVVLREGESSTRKEIIAFCSKELAPFKVPKSIEFRDGLPKTIIGKVLKRVLLEEELKKTKKI